MAFVPSTPPTVGLTSGLSHVCARPNATLHSFTLFSSRARHVITPTRTSNAANLFMMSTATESTTGGRKFLVGGNWKCNMTKDSIKELVDAFNSGPGLDDQSIEVVLAPPSCYLEWTRSLLRGDFATSGQNCWIKEGGAYTGELDAKMIADVDAGWCILGHSERRHLPQIKESDSDIATKAKYAVTQAGLKVIYCIGELLDERESGSTLAVCQRQMKALSDVIGSDLEIWKDIVIAYEPVWAIGTGKVATPEQAEEVHFDVRQWLTQNVSAQVAQSTRILYGGSVSPANCDELAKKPNVDGFLVGSASMKPTFLEIVNSYKAALASAV